MSIQKIITAKNKPPKIAEQLSELLMGTKFRFFKSDNKNDSYILASGYQLDRFNKPILYEVKSVKDAYLKALELSIFVNNNGVCSIEHLYQAVDNLNYQEICEALNINQNDEMSKYVFDEVKQVNRAFRNFYRSELEAIAIYYHHQQKQYRSDTIT